MRPYFYKIKHKKTNQYYVGSQYGKMSHPDNLFSTYFTSSKLVEELGYENFEIVYIKEMNNARQYEANYLKRAYYILGKDRFEKVLLNRNISPGIIMTEEMMKTANVKRKVSNSIVAKKRVKEGTHNFQGWDQPWTRTPEERKKRSDRMKGNNYGSYRNMDDELKKKLAEKSKGNTNVRGRIWVVNKNGHRMRVEKDQIPEGYIRGMVY